jgi:RHS repeat-associated protein
VQKTVTNGNQITITNYFGGFQYVNGNLEFFPHAEGYVKANQVTIYPTDGSLTPTIKTTFNYVFNYTDHLGNVRLSYTKNPNATNGLEIIEENHYYPFGLKHKTTPSIASSNPAYKYKYNGKELQDELGFNMYDYGARNYDATIGRWMNIDPLAEKHDSQTPYNYAINSPIFVIDPDGMDIRFASWKDIQKDDELKKQFASRKEYRQAKRELKRQLRETREKSETADKIYTDLENDSKTHTIYATKSTGGSTVKKEDGGTDIKIGVGEGEYLDGISSKDSNIKAQIGHEGGHAWLKMNGLESEKDVPNFAKATLFEVTAYNSYYENRERTASHIENMVRGELINNGVKNMNLSSKYYGTILNYTGGSFSKYGFKATAFELLNNNPYNSEGYLKQAYKLPVVKK